MLTRPTGMLCGLKIPRTHVRGVQEVGLHLYASKHQEKKLHVCLINADDNIPKVWEKEAAIKTTNNTITARFPNGAIS